MVIKLRMRWERHVAHLREMRNTYKIIGMNPVRIRALEKPRLRYYPLMILQWFSVRMLTGFN
jgi:hypothetical protein